MPEFGDGGGADRRPLQPEHPLPKRHRHRSDGRLAAPPAEARLLTFISRPAYSDRSPACAHKAAANCSTTPGSAAASIHPRYRPHRPGFGPDLEGVDLGRVRGRGLPEAQSDAAARRRGHLGRRNRTAAASPIRPPASRDVAPSAVGRPDEGSAKWGEVRDSRPGGDDARWAEALNLLAHPGDPGAKQHLARRRRTSLLVVAGAFLVLALGTALFGSRLGHPGRPAAHRHFPRPPVWRGTVGLALSACGLGLLTVGMVKRVRSGAFGADWSAPIVLLTQRQRRLLIRQATGREPADRHLLPLTRDVARRLVREDATSPFHVSGVAVGLIGQMILFARLTFALVAGGFLLVLAMAAARGQQKIARAKSFLRNHPSTDAEQAGGIP